MADPSEAQRHDGRGYLPALTGRFDLWSHDDTSLRRWENGSTAARPTQPSGEQNTITLAVWDQIRRTEEELMEMGTMDNTLLQNHGAGIKGRVRAVEKLSRIGA